MGKLFRPLSAKHKPISLKTKKLVKRIFLLFFLLMLVNSGLNFYVNPFGFFGDESVGSAPVFNARYEKYQTILAMEEKPEVLIFGSSNSMRMRPEKFEELTGLSTFNYGVFHARTEDFYCMGSLLVERPETTPKAIVLCLDDWNLAEEPPLPDEVFDGAEKRLTYRPILSKHLYDYSSFQLFWARIKAAQSWSQTKVSLRTLGQGDWSRQPANLEDVFFKDGVRKRYLNVFDTDVTDSAEAGLYAVTPDLQAHHTELLHYSNTQKGIVSGSHEDFEEYSKLRWQYLSDFLALMKEHEVKVMITIMPNQPFYLELVQESTNYDDRMVLLHHRLDSLQQVHPNLLLIDDNSRIENFSGYENHFFDHMHPTGVNCDLIIEKLVNQLPADAL